MHVTWAQQVGLFRKLARQAFPTATHFVVNRYRVSTLLQDFSAAGLSVHHHPIEDGDVPSKEECSQILKQLLRSLKRHRPTLVQYENIKRAVWYGYVPTDCGCICSCFSGLGRSCLLVALLIMLLDDSLTGDSVIEKLRSLRGPAAVQTVRVSLYVYSMIQGEAWYWSVAAIQYDPRISKNGGGESGFVSQYRPVTSKFSSKSRIKMTEKT